MKNSISTFLFLLKFFIIYNTIYIIKNITNEGIFMKDYYGILEVNSNASDEIIEKAYKTLVKKYHPDLYSSVQKIEAEKRLKDINEAYHILSDKFLRSQYDLELQKEKEQKMKEHYINNDTQKSNRANDRRQNKVTHKENKTQITYEKRKNNVGTILGIVDLIKDLWANKPEKSERKKMERIDWKALGLTIVALIVIGVILWFIPFTNGWMRQLLFENPIFNFIGGLFS